MRKLFTVFLMLVTLASYSQSDLVLTAVFDADLSGGLPKGVELYATDDIADLSLYGIGSANNGGGSNGEEFTFPAVAVSKGSYIYVTTDSAAFHDFFGFAADYDNVSAMGINGDDAVELFHNGSVADVYGDINTDGTGESWEYKDSWAYRITSTGPDGSTWTESNWNIAGVDALDGELTNATALNPVPIGTYLALPPTEVQVTFQVDMNNQTVSSNGVHLAGSFQGWNPGSTELTDGDGDGIYTFDTMLTVNDTFQYKFINDNDWPGAEDVPTNCEFPGSDNRFVIVGLSPITLDAVCFGSCVPCADLVDVTFQVDMSAETVSGLGVHVAGSFQGWNPGTSLMSNIGNDIFEFTGKAEPNSTVEFKFINGNDWPDAETVPAGCAQNGNRYVNVGTSEMTTGPYVFGSCDITQLTPDFIDISTLKQNAVDGTPLFPDTSGWIKGVVTSIDFDGNNGISFFIEDNGAGMNIFNFNDVSAYQVQMGDSIHVQGSMDFYNGLSEWFADSIVVASQGNIVADATVVTELNESTESQLIRMNDVTLADPGQWPTPGNSANVDIVTSSNDTLTMRIYEETDIEENVTPPSGMFDVIGLGSQFDGSAPHDEGYQILPRMQSDIIVGAAMTFIDINTLRLDAPDGTPLFPDTSGWIKGVVTSIDFDGNNGISFFIDDNGAGMNIFNFNDVSAYQVQMGDEVYVQGSMDFYNGLSEWFADSIVVASTGNALPNPMVVSTLDESTESQLIRMNDVTLSDPGQWPTPGNSANVDIVTSSNDTLTMRIYEETDIEENVNPPATAFDVIGLGSQFDGSAPHDEGYQILPRMQSDIMVLANDTPSVFFSQINITVNESDGTADLNISIQDPNNDTTKVDVVLTGGTATAGSDFNFNSPVTVVFPPKSTASQTVTVDIIDDTDQEGDETITFELQNPTNDARILIASATVTIEANDKPLPVYDIDEVNNVNADGVGDSVGVVCELRGVVTTINYNNDLQFWIQDPTSGINVFSFDPLASYPTVTMGDSIHVIGEIDQFNGLLEIIPDSIALISQGNDLPVAMEVDTLTEEYESELLVLNDVEITDSIPTGGGYNMEAVHDNDTIIIRIDNATDVYNMAMPMGYYRITGVGSQFDGSSPYTSGYQLQVRSFADFEAMVAPTADFDYTTDTLTAMFEDQSANYPESWSWEFGDGNTSDEQNPTHTYGADGTYEVCLTVTNSQGSNQLCDSVTVMATGIASITEDFDVNIFPVPTSNYLSIDADVIIDQVELIDAAGRRVMNKSINDNQSNLDVSNLANGYYLIKLISREGVTVKRIIKE